MSSSIKQVLSIARMETYESAVRELVNQIDALELYIWNAKVSSALLLPLHILEVATRNAVNEALCAEYGDRWPWETSFEGSLPQPRNGYNPRLDLRKARRGQHSTGKVIPELNFVFWQKMFTRRFDDNIWSKHLLNIFPTIDKETKIFEARGAIHDALEQIRRVRNRVAHHEPVFTRDLMADLASMELILKYRCADTHAWLKSHEGASTLLAKRPE